MTNTSARAAGRRTLGPFTRRLDITCERPDHVVISSWRMHGDSPGPMRIVTEMVVWRGASRGDD